MSTTGAFLEVRVGALTGARVNGVQKWAVEEYGVDLDAMDADSLGFEDVDCGTTGLRVNFEGIWDAAADGPFPVVARGTLLLNAKLMANTADDDPDYTIPIMVVTKCTRSAGVKESIRYQVEAMSKGTFTVSQNVDA